jgi:hypothetical protein
MQCPPGYYCPDPVQVLDCPEGHFCPAATVAPRPCPLGASCDQTRTKTLSPKWCAPALPRPSHLAATWPATRSTLSARRPPCRPGAAHCCRRRPGSWWRVAGTGPARRPRPDLGARARTPTRAAAAAGGGCWRWWAPSSWRRCSCSAGPSWAPTGPSAGGPSTST